MPRPHQRTRSMKQRITKLASGGGLAIHYKKPKVKAARCTRCGRLLSGVPPKSITGLSRLSTSKKRPQRMYGGQLCHACLKESLRQATWRANTT